MLTVNPGARLKIVPMFLPKLILTGNLCFWMVSVLVRLNLNFGSKQLAMIVNPVLTGITFTIVFGFLRSWARSRSVIESTLMGCGLVRLSYLAAP